MTPGTVCGLAAAVSVWSALRPRGVTRLDPPVLPRWSMPSPAWLEDRRTAAALVAGIALPVALLAGPAVGLALAVLAIALTAEVRDALRVRRRDAVAASWRAALSATAVALSAGLPLPDALVRGGQAAGLRGTGSPATALAAAAAAARLGSDVVGVLAHRCPAGTGARLVACLRIATGTGVAPAILAVRLGEAVAAEEDGRRAAAVALATARATTRVLAVLPLAGIALAAAFGASAPAYLLGSATGHACLLAAAVLEAAGLRWSARLVRREAE